MGKKYGLIALIAAIFVVWTVPASNAGTEMIIDNSAQAPPPQQYNYAPPPPPVYYAPPPVRVVVYPVQRYYVRPVRVFAYHRSHERHGFCPR
jgi:hypothetical protein